MTSETNENQKELDKNVRGENLKFSIEFENGATSGAHGYEDDFEETHTSETRKQTTTHVTQKGGKGEKVQQRGEVTARDQRQARAVKRDARRSPVFKTEAEDTPEHSDENKARDNKTQHNNKATASEKPQAPQNSGDDKTDQHTVRQEKVTGRKRKWNTKSNGNGTGTGAGSKTGDVKLPPIDNSRTTTQSSPFSTLNSTSKAKWEKPGDPGEIPIQARFRGPGPAHYLLPTTVGKNQVDLTKRNSPAFSFGSRSWSFKSDSPGPAYAVDPLLGPRGKENRPAFSFGMRPRTPVRKNTTPGPGSYNTDVAPLWERNAPQYSLSPRNKMRSVDAVPSPNTYALPSTLGDKVPHQKGGISHSLYPRREKHGPTEDLANTPGPAKYGAFSPSLVKRKSPEYSVSGRNFNKHLKNVTPGPGAYSPQNVTSHYEQTPRHVIGVRHSEFIMPTLTPADCE